jgi:TetR/AcrR family transcriptional regulator, transcriptional repressor for nem operon
MPANRAPGRTASVAGSAPAGRLTAKGQRSRERIVAAAAELIFERGVAGTTVEDVQSAAGASASQLYHYFPSKNDLVRAVIQYQEQGVVGAQEQALAHLDTLDGLRAWADAVVDVQRQLHCRGGCPIGSLGSELAETDPEARFEVAASFERWAGAIRDGLRSMQAHGRLSASASPDDLAVAVLAALQGGFLLGQVQRSIRPLRTALDAMLALIATYAASPTSLGGLQAQVPRAPARRSPAQHRRAASRRRTPAASRRLRLLELPGDGSYLGMKPVEPDERSEIGKEHNREDVVKSGVPVEVEY